MVAVTLLTEPEMGQAVGQTGHPYRVLSLSVTLQAADSGQNVRSCHGLSDSQDTACRALNEAHARGWRIELVNDWPTITASLDSMSPALVDRLKEHAEVIARLREAGR